MIYSSMEWLDAGSMLLQLAFKTFNSGFSIHRLLCYGLLYSVLSITCRNSMSFLYRLSDNVDATDSYQISWSNTFCIYARLHCNKWVVGLHRLWKLYKLVRFTKRSVISSSHNYSKYFNGVNALKSIGSESFWVTCTYTCRDFLFSIETHVYSVWCYHLDWVYHTRSKYKNFRRDIITYYPNFYAPHSYIGLSLIPQSL